MMDINYELYKVFYYVAKTLSFSDASKALFISQSAVSQSVKTLEKKLGQNLFLRSTKKVQLTTEGEILFKHIEPAMNLIRKGEAQLFDTSSLSGGQLRIAASDTICRYYLVPYLNRFHSAYPGVHIKVTNSTSIECAHILENGQVDFIVTNYPNSSLQSTLKIRPIYEFHDVFIAVKRALRLFNGAFRISHHDAGPEKHHQRISPLRFPAVPPGSGPGDRIKQQRPADRSGPHRFGDRLRSRLLRPRPG